jgi:hypothetical protein
MQENNGVQKIKFEKDWVAYILGFEDNCIKEDEWNASDRDLEAYYYGADISSPYLSQADKIKIKRYRRDDCKR